MRIVYVASLVPVIVGAGRWSPNKLPFDFVPSSSNTICQTQFSVRKNVYADERNNLMVFNGF